MIEKFLNSATPSLLGLLQALLVVIYVGKVAAFMFFVEKNISDPGFFGVVVFLTLFVFSAGITGTLVFGSPAYFALKGNVARAMRVLLYTFGYLFVALVFAIATIVFFFTK